MTGVAELIVGLWLAAVACNIILPLLLFVGHGCIRTIAAVCRTLTPELSTLNQSQRAVATSG